MGPKFKGFSMPEGTLMPPEFEYLVPLIKRGSELRVLTVILIHYLRPGIDATGLTYAEIEERGGIRSRETVVRAVRALLDDYRVIERRQMGRTFRYEPVISSSLKIVLSRMHAVHGSVVEQSSTVVKLHACDETEISARQAAADALADRCGVARHVAEKMAVDNDPDLIFQHIDFTLFARRQGFIRKTMAAYVVASIRGNWQQPIDYKAEASGLLSDDPEWKAAIEYTNKRLSEDEEFQRRVRENARD